MYYAAQDLLEYLMNSAGGGAQDSEHRVLRQAAFHAYRDVINARDWNWHVSSGDLEDDVAGDGDGVKTFTLPAGVKNVDALIPPQNLLTPTAYISPAEWERINTVLPQLNMPIYWTVMRDSTTPDRWQIRIAGSPSTSTFRYTYRRRPKNLQYMGYEPICRTTGFAPDGAVRRYGTATNYPEGMAGLHPFTAQEIIGQAESMIGEPPENAKTVVSDYLDVSDSMLTAVLSATEVWLAKLMGKNIEGAMTVYQRDLRMACEADVLAPVSGQRFSRPLLGTPRALGYYGPSGPDN
jgi:hypothetical protein